MYTGWIAAIDPGVHTGLVLCDGNDKVQLSKTATDFDAIELFLEYAYGATAVDFNLLAVIESYAGAGHLSRETIITLETLGFVHGHVSANAVDVHFQPPQRRLAYEGRARLVFPSHEERHMRSALAHALCARESYSEVQV